MLLVRGTPSKCSNSCLATTLDSMTGLGPAGLALCIRFEKDFLGAASNAPKEKQAAKKAHGAGAATGHANYGQTLNIHLRGLHGALTSNGTLGPT